MRGDIHLVTIGDVRKERITIQRDGNGRRVILTKQQADLQTFIDVAYQEFPGIPFDQLVVEIPGRNDLGTLHMSRRMPLLFRKNAGNGEQYCDVPSYKTLGQLIQQVDSLPVPEDQYQNVKFFISATEPITLQILLRPD